MHRESKRPSTVWETVVFVLNILAFIFIGLQLRPILESLEPAARGRYFLVAAAVLVTVIVVRFAWHMSFNAVIRWRDRRRGFRPPRPLLRPTIGSGLVIAWAGMRGIVSLAAAIALPALFPYRDLKLGYLLFQLSALNGEPCQFIFLFQQCLALFFLFRSKAVQLLFCPDKAIRKVSKNLLRQHELDSSPVEIKRTQGCRVSKKTRVLFLDLIVLDVPPF